jgi:hypothetical protein
MEQRHLDDERKEIVDDSIEKLVDKLLGRKGCDALQPVIHPELGGHGEEAKSARHEMQASHGASE